MSDTDHSENVMIIGASDDPARYSYKAMMALLGAGFPIVLVHPRIKQINAHPVIAKLDEVTTGIDTVTLYVRPSISEPLAQDLINLHPRRVIFNPGTESNSLAQMLTTEGIEVQEACTLVLLSTGQF